MKSWMLELGMGEGGRRGGREMGVVQGALCLKGERNRPGKPVEASLGGEGGSGVPGGGSWCEQRLSVGGGGKGALGPIYI